MIYFLVKDEYRDTFDTYLGSWGRQLRSRSRVVSYEHLARQRRVPVGAYVFSDLERLLPAELERAAAVWQALASSGQSLRLLNHPLRAMRRYELLRTLYERGLNDFDAYRVTDGRRPRRFPVFIRGENDHRGAQSTLLHRPEALAAAIEQLSAQGRAREERLIVEFRSSPDERGLYRKYGAFVVAGRVIPKHLLFGREWVVKGATRVIDAGTLEEERRYLRENPHEQHLREVFALARIDYGRVDYGVVDGRVEIYEINTNPQICVDTVGTRVPNEVNARVEERLAEALAALDRATPARRTRIPVPIAGTPRRWRRLWVKPVRALRLSQYEPLIRVRLVRLEVALRRRVGLLLGAHQPLEANSGQVAR